MPSHVKYTEEEQKILDHAKHEIAHVYDKDMHIRYQASGDEKNCLIHATLGTKTEEGLVAKDHTAIRAFLFAIVNSFNDQDLVKGKDDKQPLRDLMNEIGTVAYTYLEDDNKEVALESAFARYRDELCNDDDDNKKRFLNTAEMRLLAIVINAYILNWTLAGDKVSLHKGHIFAPDTQLRDLLMSHLREKEIVVPQLISDCDEKAIRVIHVENTNNIHFRRVEWNPKLVIESDLFPQLYKAIELQNNKLGRTADASPRPTSPSPKLPESPKIQELPTVPDSPKIPEVLPPKLIPNPVKGLHLDREGFVNVKGAKVVWTDDEKKKIYRNNINYLLYMMAQSPAAKKLFVKQLPEAAINTTVVHRLGDSRVFYTKVDHTDPEDVAGLLIENITAYEKLKSKHDYSGHLLKQYQDLKKAIQERTNDEDLLNHPATESFKSHAFVRTNHKKTFLYDKVTARINTEAPQDARAMIHRKAADSIATPTQYHMVGLGDLKAAAQWINDDMPKDKHILKQGTLKYRLYLREHPKQPNQYQIYKCEVDDQGVFKPGTKALSVTPADEALWSKEIEAIFKAYGEHKKITVIPAGFKPKQ